MRNIFNLKATRRDFLKKGAALGIGALSFSPLSFLASCSSTPERTDLLDELYSASLKKNATVSIVKIRDGNIARAVEEAIEKIGGIRKLTRGKQSIMLKPNLVSEARMMTTKVEVMEPLARLMIAAGKQVTIGEGSAAVDGVNHRGGEDYRTKNIEMLEAIQKRAYEQTGYTEMAQRLKIPLVNFHTGNLKSVRIKDGYIFDEFTLHKSLLDTDMFCSVPMMKTHQLATVTLSMKNLFGIIPGAVYGTVRGNVHDLASKKDKTGTDAAIMDLLKVRPIDLAVVDASSAMEGNGPSFGPIVPMNLIIAGKNPLAVDMVSALLMGFDPEKIPTFSWAHRSGMTPFTLGEIEVVGERVENVWRKFTPPQVYSWDIVGKVWGHRVLAGRRAARAGNTIVS